MKDAIAELRLQQSLRECRKHAHYMRYALNALKHQAPWTGALLQSLDAEAVQDLDQFVLRFSKLQDALGGRLFGAVLAVLDEPICRLSLIEQGRAGQGRGCFARALRVNRCPRAKNGQSENPLR